METTDGETLTGEERRAPSSPTNPLLEARWEAKFEDCTASVLDAVTQTAVLDVVDRLEESGSLYSLVAASRPD